jgi:Arc/MetJ-type ribon-helix-helix transcriptional regulator
MSRQIAVRLPEDMVAWVDERVNEGAVASRAELVALALERERRIAIAARDAEILARADQDADMDSLAEHVAGAPLPLR